MKLTSQDLRQLIDEEIKQLMTDDAIFMTKDLPGLQHTKDIPGDDAHHKKHHDAKSYMAKPQLFKISNYASKIHDMIGDDEQLSDWMESHIAQVSQMIGSIYHSLDYKKKTGKK
tara:strand:- start:896 stop:1237 length:342 start_codon:yes stop_codon:yes gene_type:complete